MIRSTILAGALAMALLSGCERPDQAATNAQAGNDAALTNDMAVEDLPSDSLAAPGDMPLDSESNAAGSAGGGNAM